MQVTRTERRDITATLASIVMVAAVVVMATVLRALTIFTPDGIAMTVPLRGETVDLIPAVTPPGDALPVTTLRIMTGELVAQDVNAVSVVAIAAALVVGAAAWIAVIALVVTLCLRFLRGEFFHPHNPRLLEGTSYTMLGGALAVLLLEKLGLNGVLAATGLGDYDVDSWALISPFVPIWIAAVVLGLIALAFRRGIRLQRDTEGLV